MKQIDVVLGKKIKQRRTQLGLSQAELGELLQLSAQQIQRYESGENTISVSKLIPLARCLNLEASDLLEGLNEEPVTAPTLLTREEPRKLRLMIVEDDSADVILLMEAIQETDTPVEIIHVYEADKLLQTLKSMSALPDVILMDINMPRTNGIDALKELKKSSFKQLPVVMLSNSIRMQDLLAAYDAHASGYIQKNAQSDMYVQDIVTFVTYWRNVCVTPARYKN